jgi:hypothetical protein
MVYEKGHKPKNALNLKGETDRYMKTMSKFIADAWHKPEFVQTVEALSMDADLLALTKKLIADPAFRSTVAKLIIKPSTH